jgi:mono/diheme cytochrome c family protein
MKLRYSIPFLAAFCFCSLSIAADMPEGAGKAIIDRECSNCHDTGRISGQKKTKDDWIDTVSRMQGKGAALNDREFDTVIEYLMKNFGKPDAIEAHSPAKSSSHR